MKYSPLDTKNFKNKKWKNTDLKSKDDKYSLTMKQYEESLK